MQWKAALIFAAAAAGIAALLAAFGRAAGLIDLPYGVPILVTSAASMGFGAVAVLTARTFAGALCAVLLAALCVVGGVAARLSMAPDAPCRFCAASPIDGPQVARNRGADAG